MDKPNSLYHGSQNKNIKVFMPQHKSYRDKNEGAVVFATPDKVLASIFIVPTNDSWTHSGLFGGIHYFVCSDKKRFIELDKGGTIYTLPSDTFECDPERGLGSKEWTSIVEVKPINQENFDSALELMIDMGVQVYFVDDEIFKKINESKDHGNKILRSLISENKRLNKNNLEIPKINQRRHN